MTKLKKWGMPAFHLAAIRPLLLVIAAAGATLLGVIPTVTFIGTTAVSTPIPQPLKAKLNKKTRAKCDSCLFMNRVMFGITHPLYIARFGTETKTA